jgi:hypothetical protein
MFYEAIVKENAKHSDAGGNLAELTISKQQRIFLGDTSIKINVCVDGSNCCVGVLSEWAKLTRQLQS